MAWNFVAEQYSSPDTYQLTLLYQTSGLNGVDARLTQLK